MIISINPKPSLEEFKELVDHATRKLNQDAESRPEYYRGRVGTLLESDVYDALIACSDNTPFKDTIFKISGQKFPDIVVHKFYGVEVKSTKEDKWTSTGSSIIESTRVPDVERIFMTFGKMGGEKIEFISRPYEECLYGIAITHMPRYLINMELKKGETIFDKMSTTYDELRHSDNPISSVSKYYKSTMKKGESLWWTGDSDDEVVSATVRLWKNLTPDEKKQYVIYACVNFPEIFSGDYDEYSLWLSSQGVVDPHIRDQFSAGGQESMQLGNGMTIKFPGVYRRVKTNVDEIAKSLSKNVDKYSNEVQLSSIDEKNRKIIDWCKRVSGFANVDATSSLDALMTLFFGVKKVISINDGKRQIKCRVCGNLYKQVWNNKEFVKEIVYEDNCPYCGSLNAFSDKIEFDNKRDDETFVEKVKVTKKTIEDNDQEIVINVTTKKRK